MEGGFQGQLDTVYHNEAKLLQENGKLQVDLDLANKRIKELESLLDTSNAEINVKTAEARDASKRLVCCEEARADAENHLVKLNVKFSALSEQYEDLENRYQIQEGLYISTCKKIEVLEVETEDMISKLSDLQKRLEEANQCYHTEQAENIILKQNVSNLHLTKCQEIYTLLEALL